MLIGDVRLALTMAAGIISLSAMFALLAYIVLAVRAILTPNAEHNSAGAAAVCFVFGLLGIVIGFPMAASKLPIIGSVLPGVLTFAGGAALLMFTQKASPTATSAETVGAAVAGFSVMLFVGYNLGILRLDRSLQISDLQQAAQEAQVYDVNRLRRQAEVEYGINQYRNALGLEALVFPGFPDTDKDEEKD
jgi:ABC-type xylose transport system permease subunit